MFDGKGKLLEEYRSQRGVGGDIGTKEFRRTQRGIRTYMDRLWTSKDDHYANRLLSLFLADTGIQFNIVNNKWFRRFLGFLRKDYAPATRDGIKNVHLKEIKEIMEPEAESLLKNCGSVTLGGDGSQDVSEGIHHICALTPKPLLLANVREPGAKKSAEWVFNKVKEQKDYLAKIGVLVAAYISDNESKERKVRKLVQSNWGIGTIGCGTHSYSLISKDYYGLRENKATIEKANYLHNKIKNTKLGQMVYNNIKEREVKEKILRLYPSINIHSTVCIFCIFILYFLN